WMPTFLERVIGLLETNARCGIAFADAHRITQDGAVVGRFSDDCAFLRGRRFAELLTKNFVSALSAVAVRRDAAIAAGGFVPDYRICEEYDLFLKIASRYEIDFTPEILASYRWHGRNASSEVERTIHEALAILDYWTAQPGVASAFRRHIDSRRSFLLGKLALYRAMQGQIRSAAWDAQAAAAALH